MSNDNIPDFRWRAVIEYRTNNGVIDVEHFFEEIEELHDIIEHGPSWDAMVKCVITIARPAYGGETIESAMAR